MVINKYFVFKCLFFNLLFIGYVRSWSSFYSKSIVVPKSKKNSTCFFWTKKNVPDYTQLIFSWNSFRPSKGHYDFWIRGRDSKTKKWYEWHKMFSWGRGVQESFINCSRNGTSYYHVRLESPKDRFLDGYSIQVKAHGGAGLFNIKNLYVSVSDFNKFKPEYIFKKKLNYSNVSLNSIPLISQMKLNHPDFDSLCSPTSVSMLLGYLLKKEVNSCNIADNVFDKGLKGYGSWGLNTAHAFDFTQGKFKFYVKRLDSFDDIYSSIEKSLPVIVSIRGPLEGAALPHKNGHLLVVVGYDKEKQEVICNDPAFPEDAKTRVGYNIDNFIKAWERSRRLAYMVESGY